MSSKHRAILLSFFIAIVVLLAGIVYHLARQQRLIQEMRGHVAQGSYTVPTEVPSSPTNQEAVTTRSQVWRSVQEKVQDTVVQVYSHVAEVNLLQPYITPSQYSSTGSAFFINAEGELITNAHVINQARGIWIHIPSLGKRIIDVELVGLSPERDLALLRLTPESLAMVRKELGSIPYLSLGDSDRVCRADEVLALGYPLGQQSLKSTNGLISGREHHFIQMSAPINPGNSGGPLLNVDGQVVGINSANVPNAQNVGYIIPINDWKIIEADLHTTKILRRPYLGIIFSESSQELTEFLGNPAPGGAYVVETLKNSTLDKAGVKRGDMIYAADGHVVDMYGQMRVPWSEDKISLTDYAGRLPLGSPISLQTYRNGQARTVNVILSQNESTGVRKIYPGYEPLDYEVIGGMVIMQLTVNHIHALISNAPGLSRYAELERQHEPTLVISHVFPDSQSFRMRTIKVGETINEVNGTKVHTLDEFRDAVKAGAHDKYLTMKLTDNVAKISDDMLVVLSYDKVLQEERKLAHDYHYRLSPMLQELVTIAENRTSTAPIVTA